MEHHHSLTEEHIITLLLLLHMQEAAGTTEVKTAAAVEARRLFLILLVFCSGNASLRSFISRCYGKKNLKKYRIFFTGQRRVKTICLYICSQLTMNVLKEIIDRILGKGNHGEGNCPSGR
ncbi:hypothetical protein CDL15_Pgr002885 [Punica granatum]|uniref:Secreted protein n=1 Tax=Punica granatum TaxID=22663 RepID=A0A218X199_PUNGR|nr:hypothetical protein CDL15_Pgr002885 [Punica granatum]